MNAAPSKGTCFGFEVHSDLSFRYLRGGTGEPLGVEIKMWWNFVARTLEEMTDAWRAWRSHDHDRFGPVPSRLARIDAPRPPWLRASAEP